MNRNLRLLAVAGGALVFLACQSPTPRDPSLDRVRQAYLLTRADPLIAEHAATELLRARQMLRAAERAWSSGSDDDAVKALAWLALQDVQRARALTAARFDDSIERVPPTLEAGFGDGATRERRDDAGPGLRSPAAFKPTATQTAVPTSQLSLAPTR